VNARARWLTVATVAAAMAWMEAASVTYLRTASTAEPSAMPVLGFDRIEVIREAATMLMLLGIGVLAGRTRQGRLGYAMTAFGLWDILYYVFLKVILAWPHSLTDWDVLFAIPVRWWGPVIAPIVIAVLLVVGGTLASRLDQPGRRVRVSLEALACCLCGILVALYVFMADSLRAWWAGGAASGVIAPTTFNWWLFVIAVTLMTIPVIQLARETHTPSSVGKSDDTGVGYASPRSRAGFWRAI
jgi:hypothetical protein